MGWECKKCRYVNSEFNLRCISCYTMKESMNKTTEKPKYKIVIKGDQGLVAVVDVQVYSLEDAFTVAQKLKELLSQTSAPDKNYTIEKVAKEN
jgi:hypothetical protein